MASEPTLSLGFLGCRVFLTKECKIDVFAEQLLVCIVISDVLAAGPVPAGYHHGDLGLDVDPLQVNVILAINKSMELLANIVSGDSLAYTSNNDCSATFCPAGSVYDRSVVLVGISGASSVDDSSSLTRFGIVLFINCPMNLSAGIPPLL